MAEVLYRGGKPVRYRKNCETNGNNSQLQNLCDASESFVDTEKTLNLNFFLLGANFFDFKKERKRGTHITLIVRCAWLMIGRWLHR